MQPLDINKIDAKIITATELEDKKALAEVLTEISCRIMQAISPVSGCSAPLVILALKASAKTISDQVPVSYTHLRAHET